MSYGLIAVTIQVMQYYTLYGNKVNRLSYKVVIFCICMVINSKDSTQQNLVYRLDHSKVSVVSNGSNLRCSTFPLGTAVLVKLTSDHCKTAKFPMKVCWKEDAQAVASSHKKKRPFYEFPRADRISFCFLEAWSLGSYQRQLGLPKFVPALCQFRSQNSSGTSSRTVWKQCLSPYTIKTKCLVDNGLKNVRACSQSRRSGQAELHPDNSSVVTGPCPSTVSLRESQAVEGPEKAYNAH